jgi:tetratricopeptide (TPR) repeat protein
MSTDASAEIREAPSTEISVRSAIEHAAADIVAAADQRRGGRPSEAEAQFRAAAAPMQAGNLKRATAFLKRAIALDPKHLGAHNNLGIVHRMAGRTDAAIASFARALALDPAYVLGIVNLGTALRDKGRNADAIACLKHAAALEAESFPAWFNLGNAYFAEGKFADAAAALRQALALKPDQPGAHNNLGQALHKLGRVEEAVAEYRRALELRPNDPGALFNLIMTLKNNFRLDEAADCCRRLIAASPRSAEAHNNLGAVIQAQGRIDEALACYRRAIALKTDYPDAQVNESILLLMCGDFEPGWKKYEWRWKLKGYEPRGYRQPEWQGEEIRGKTIVLHSEQGFGDTIHFARYAPMVVRRGAKVVVEVPSPLKNLIASLKAPLRVLAKGETLPHFDLYCPLGTLPRVFGTRIDTIPAQVPYLYADPAIVARWKTALGTDPGFKVGIAWAGNAQHTNDHNRSIKFERLRPLIETPGVRWFSLQVGPHAADLAALAPGRVTDLAPKLTDFNETAGALANLDLLISADTSVIHLAGAMGRPVWAMIPFIPDWRWQFARRDSPWYPSMRLFRQPAVDDWETVVARIRLDLERLILGVGKVAVASVGKSTAGDAVSTNDRHARVLGEASRLFRAGRLQEAATSLERLIAERPRDFATLHLFSAVRAGLGENRRALELESAALAVNPESFEAHTNRGILLSKLGRHEEAVASFETALALEPNHAEAHSGLGYTLYALGRHAQSVESSRKALDLKPDHLDSLNNMGAALFALDRPEEALARFQRALELKPDFLSALVSLGAVLVTLERPADAIRCLERAVAVDANSAEAHFNLGRAFRAANRLPDAIRSYQRAIALRPDYAQAHRNLGIAALCSGDFKTGWPEYEWRWRMPQLAPARRDLAAKRLEPGDRVHGKRVLLYGEQGFGDTIQFARCAGPLARLGAEVSVEVQKGLGSVMAGLPGAARILERGDPLPPVDFECPMLSLLPFLGIALESIPAKVPYLAAPPERVASWRARLGPKKLLRVGLAWSGNPAHSFDRGRSIALERVGHLLRLSGIEWHSLQKDVAPEDRALLAALGVAEHSEALGDFGDTAALASLMDLVVSVDTSVAHLAGALALPVRILLPFMPDWRWMLERDDSPWYPSARLFRQTAPGDWRGPLATLDAELKRRVARDGRAAKLRPRASRGSPKRPKDNG